jgi:hypothetical protein
MTCRTDLDHTATLYAWRGCCRVDVGTTAQAPPTCAPPPTATRTTYVSNTHSTVVRAGRRLAVADVPALVVRPVAAGHGHRRQLLLQDGCGDADVLWEACATISKIYVMEYVTTG